MEVSTLAGSIGADPKDIRKFLRSEYGRPNSYNRRWDLTPQQVERVRWRFEGVVKVPRSPRAPSTSGGIIVPPLVRRHSGPQIITRVKQLIDNPEDIHIRVDGSGEDLVFHRIIQEWSSRRGGSKKVILLSNGEFKEPKDIRGPGDHLLEPQYCLIERGGRYYAHHNGYVAALSEVSIQPWIVKTLVEREESTGRDDTPQELLITLYSRYFSTCLGTSYLLKWELENGKSFCEVTLRSLYSDDGVSELPARSYGESFDRDFHLSLARYFATVNLLKEHPLNGDAFNVTIGEVFRRFHIEVGKRAESLRNEVATRLGFTGDGREGWTKKVGGDEVEISNDLRVHINRKFVCIVSAKTSNLPYDDEIARRMLAVATAHRDQIYTIRGEIKEALERLFPIEQPL